MATRRPNRASWIRETPNGRGYYEAMVWMGVKANGRPDRRHIQRATLTAVRKAVRELETARARGTATAAGTPRTVKDMLERHITVVLPARGRAPRTITDYLSKCRNDIYPRWGAVRIDRLTAENIEDGYAAMLTAGHAPSHVRKVHAILSSALAEQAKRGHIARNPCDLVQPPSVRQAERVSITQAQARKVLAAIAQRRNAARWAVGLACGLRQGEALGLRWSYVDLDAGEMQVWWQLQRLPWQHGCYASSGRSAGLPTDLQLRDTRITYPQVSASSKKSSGRPCKGKRGADCPARHGGGLVFREIKEKRRKVVPLGPELVAALRAHRAVQAAERLHAGPMWADADLVFTQADGRPVDPRADWEEWRDILAAAGVPHVGTHGARHAMATFAIEAGVALRVVQQMLGHSDVRVTEGYTHVSSPLTRDGAARVERLLFDGKR